MDPVAQTSRWMAAARARESERPYRLFDDPLASALAGPEGFAWLDRMEFTRPWGRSALYVVVRTRFFDDFLRHASWVARAKQVVLLAADMDARTFCLDWPPGTRLYELDQPEVLSVKNEIIADAGARPRLRAAHDWSGPGAPFMVRGALKRGLRNPEALRMAHGGSPTLHDRTRRPHASRHCERADGTPQLARYGSRNEDLLTSPTMQPLLAAFTRRGAPVHLGVNDPEALLAEYVWKAEATQPGEQGANYGRWPYPVVPRGIPGVPRIFFTKAQREVEH